MIVCIAKTSYPSVLSAGWLTQSSHTLLEFLAKVQPPPNQTEQVHRYVSDSGGGVLAIDKLDGCGTAAPNHDTPSRRGPRKCATDSGSPSAATTTTAATSPTTATAKKSKTVTKQVGDPVSTKQSTSAKAAASRPTSDPAGKRTATAAAKRGGAGNRRSGGGGGNVADAIPCDDGGGSDEDGDTHWFSDADKYGGIGARGARGSPGKLIILDNATYGDDRASAASTVTA